MVFIYTKERHTLFALFSAIVLFLLDINVHKDYLNSVLHPGIFEFMHWSILWPLDRQYYTFLVKPNYEFFSYKLTESNKWANKSQKINGLGEISEYDLQKAVQLTFRFLMCFENVSRKYENFGYHVSLLNTDLVMYS